MYKEVSILCVWNIYFHLKFPDLIQCYASCTHSAELHTNIALVFLVGREVLSAEMAWFQVEICNPDDKYERKSIHSQNNMTFFLYVK
jgi:hypothetical protein